MTDTAAAELLPRLRLIEEQPLDQRAAAFALLHDQLQVALDSADTARSRG